MLLNVLDFNEIQNFILTILTHGLDYQIYFYAAMLKSVKLKILTAATNENLVQVLSDPELFKSFHAIDYIEFMDQLKSRHSQRIFEAFKSCH